MQMQGSKVLKPGFQYSIENLRGLAIIFVTLSHVSTYGSLGVLGDYLFFLVRDATAWFIFISGYLFNYLERSKFDYRNYLSKKVRYVLLPYLILSVPAIIAGLLFQRHRVLDLEVGQYALWSLVVGGSVIVPMWFIPMILLFFLLSPLFHRLGGYRQQLMITLLGLGVSLLTTRPVDNLNPPLALVHFAGFYMLGITVFTHYAKISEFARTKKARILIILAALGFVVSSLVTLILHSAEPVGFRDGIGVFNYIGFGKLCLLAVVFLLFERHMNVRNRVLGWMAQISFGLFFLQGFFMVVFQKTIQNLPSIPPGLLVLSEVVFVLGGSVVAVVVLKKILGGRSRYVIGC